MPATPFYDFVTAVNAHDADRLSALMTTDHEFVDAIGNIVSGVETCRKGWIQYFQLFPDYMLELTDALETPLTVMATGFASGTYLGKPGEKNENYWRIPAAWKASVQGEKIRLWQVFADTKIPYESIQHRVQAGEGPGALPGESGGAAREDNPHKRATAIGGVFFKCKDPLKVKAWYGRHLGLKIDAYGTSFAWKQAPEGSRKGFTAWSPFADDTNYFAPSAKPFMINFRVENIVRIVEHVKQEGVIVLDDIQTYPYGKFVHVLDPEDNKVELWEADDDEYEKLLEGITY